MDPITEAFNEIDAGVTDSPDAEDGSSGLDLQQVAESDFADGHDGEDTEAATDQDEADESSSAPADDPFADLKTAAGITKAREEIEKQKAEVTKRQRGFDRAFTKLTARENDHKAKVAAFQARQAPAEKAAATFLSDLAIVHPSSTASVRDRFLAMGRMAGRDPREFYEELSMGMLKDGPAEGAPSPSEKRLKAEIEQLRQEREAEKRQLEAEKEQAIARAAQNHKESAVRATAAAITAEAFPELHAAAAGKPKAIRYLAEKAVAERFKHYDRTGEKLDMTGSLAILEAALRKAKGTAASQPPTGRAAPPTSRGGRTGASQKTGTAKPLGRTVTSTVADTTTGGKKVLSDDERRERNLQDPDFRRMFGGILG